MTVRVLLADDHPVVRAGIRAMLEKAPDIQVVGEATEGAEVRRLTAELYPQVLLLDLGMPGPPVEETVAWVRAHHPETAVLVLTAYDVNTCPQWGQDLTSARCSVTSTRTGGMSNTCRRS